MLCDVILKNGENGLDVVREIQTIRDDLSFLFMSGYTDSLLEEHSAIAKIGLLNKPFSLVELQERLLSI